MFGRKSPNDGASQATLERDATGTREEQPLELSEETRSVLDQFREQWDRLGSELREQQDRCIGELIAHCERLQHRRREQAKSIEGLKREAAQLRKQWDELAVDAAQMREQRDVLAAETEQLRTTRNESTAQTDQLRQERDEAATNADQLRTARDEAAAEADQMRQQRDELATEADQLRQERDKIAADAAQLRRKHDELIAKTDQLRKERDQSASDVDQLRRQREELVGEVAQLSEERDLLASEFRKHEDNSSDSLGQDNLQDHLRPPSTYEPIEPVEPPEYYPEDQVHELAGAIEEEENDLAEMQPVADPIEEDEDAGKKSQAKSRVWEKLVARNRQHDDRAPADAPVEASRPAQTARAVPRCVRGARVMVIPDSDRNQTGIEGRLHQVTCTGTSLILPKAMKADEYVVIEMANASERTRVEVRAFVRQVTPLVDETFLVGFSLITQLEYGEVQGLRSP